MSQLGRLTPPNFNHVAAFPLTAATTPTKPTPVVLGIAWYEAFDKPEKVSGRWWIGRNPNRLGQIRGGHAICALPAGASDLTAWWDFYNQGPTGMCVGFSSSRCMSLLNRARYDAPWLYYQAQDRAGQARDPGAGTYISTAFEELRVDGHKFPSQPAPRVGAGISAYRWATAHQDVLSALDPNSTSQYRQLGGVPLLNSWGRHFPHVTWLPLTLLDYLLHEDGEACIPTDR